MRQEVNPEEQLRVIDGAPVLGKAASAGERWLGAASVAALFAGLVATSTSDVSTLVDCCVLLAALTLILRWRWFHLRAPRRRPHTKAEERVAFFAPVALAAPASTMLGNSATDLTAAFVMTAIPSAVLAGYLVLRWRR
ncbi:hypothetical protein [Streptomyces ureilyticus]|uniref:Uncharacterized protein n=1 Tax=Streptomyces ureilyticus TaxID=1775131 RepID=A0ABX0E094_9ACTN|nr:hypothetical protein [Streptomyces ureilyticus]NGO47623.1 hypothetical protein [Streptomyces ureilyticus]